MLFPKKTGKFIATLCILLCLNTVVFCSEGVGPKIKGVQLGMKISLEDLVNWLIDTGKLPFSLDINSFGGGIFEAELLATKALSF